MDLHRGFEILTKAVEDVPTRTKHPAVNTAQSHKVCSAMRALYTKVIGSLAGSVAVGGILCQPAAADLRAVTNTDDIEGSVIELRSPDGYTCRFTDAERPSLTVGAGLAASPVIPGVGNSEFYSEGRIGEPQPVAAVILRIPLGVPPNNCAQVVKIETATMRVRRAQELYELGLIELEQLELVAAKAYEVISAD